MNSHADALGTYDSLTKRALHTERNAYRDKLIGIHNLLFVREPCLQQQSALDVILAATADIYQQGKTDSRGALSVDFIDQLPSSDPRPSRLNRSVQYHANFLALRTQHRVSLWSICGSAKLPSTFWWTFNATSRSRSPHTRIFARSITRSSREYDPNTDASQTYDRERNTKYLFGLLQLDPLVFKSLRSTSELRIDIPREKRTPRKHLHFFDTRYLGRDTNILKDYRGRHGITEQIVPCPTRRYTPGRQSKISAKLGTNAT